MRPVIYLIIGGRKPIFHLLLARAGSAELIQWTMTSSTTAPARLRMMVVQVVIYSVWQQRNNILHNQSLLPPMVAFRVLNRLIINSIYASRHRRNSDPSCYYGLFDPSWFLFYWLSVFLLSFCQGVFSIRSQW